MLHVVAVAASVVSFALVCAIYHTHVLAAPESWLRSDVLAMTLVSLLTGLFPMAAVASFAGLWQAFAGGVTTGAFLSAGSDLLGIAASLATLLVFRAVVKAVRKGAASSGGKSPVAPRPVNVNRAPKLRKAA